MGLSSYTHKKEGGWETKAGKKFVCYKYYTEYIGITPSNVVPCGYPLTNIGTQTEKYTKQDVLSLRTSYV